MAMKQFRHFFCECPRNFLVQTVLVYQISGFKNRPIALLLPLQTLQKSVKLKVGNVNVGPASYVRFIGNTNTL